MTSRTHECPAAGCHERVASEHLMCEAHWYMAPKRLRDETWREWNRFRSGRDSGRSYMRARGALIRAVNAQIRQPTLL